jgi:hypothetical protein
MWNGWPVNSLMIGLQLLFKTPGMSTLAVSVSVGGGTDFVAAFGTTRTGAADDDTSPFILFREGNAASVRIRIGNGTTNVALKCRRHRL